MAEETMLSEQTQPREKPRKLWSGALKMVKGENSAKLIEEFTSEMTLVAEGLCEDQSRLRREMDQMMNEEDRRIQKLESRVAAAESAAEEQARENDRIVTELRDRLSALEKQSAKDAKALREQQREKEKRRERNRIRDLTILIVVAAVAVIAVTLVIKLVP